MTEQELQAIFEKMRNGVELTNAEMIELARNSGYVSGQMKRLEVGVKDFEKGLKKAADELPTALLKSAGNTAAATARLTKDLGEAATGFKQLTPIIDAASNALGKLPVIGAAFTAAAEASKFMINQLQVATDAFQEVSKVGGLTAKGMSGLQEQFLQSGMTLKAYTKTITANSSALAAFAGSVGEGAEKFSKTAGAVQKDFGTGLMRLGFSFDEIGETTAAYIARQTQLGLAQGRSHTQLASGAAAYAKELDALARLTGVNRKELEKEQESALSESRFRAQSDEMIAEGREKEAKAMLNFQSMVKNASPEMAQGLRDLTTGFISSDAAKKLQQTAPEALAILERVKAGQIDNVQAFKELQASTESNIATNRSAAKTMGENPFFVNYAQSMKFLNTQVDAYGNIVKEQTDAEKGKGDPSGLTDATVNAQRSMQQMSIEIQKLGFTYMPHAAKAVEGFTGSLQTLVNFVTKTLGAPATTIGGVASGGAPAGGGTPAQKAAARRQAQMEQARQKAEEDVMNLDAGPAFGRVDTAKADKVQLTLEEIREELKKLVKLGGVPGVPGAMPSAGGGAPAAAGGGGAPAAGGAPSSATTAPSSAMVSGDFGHIAEKYESAGRGSGTVGWDLVGGTSYGKKQISSKVGAMTDYLKYLDKVGKGDIAQRLREAGIEKDTGGTTGKAVDVWKEIAASGALGNTETEFLKSQSYDVAFAGLKDEELKSKIGGSKALQEMLFSTAVQHGGGGARGILNTAYKKGMTEEDLVKAVYAERGAEGGKKHFGGSTEAVRAGVVGRFGREQADIMALLGMPGTAPTAPTATAAATAPVAPGAAPVSPMLTTPAAPAMAPTAAPAMTAGLAGQGQNIIASGLQALTTQLFGGGAQGAPAGGEATGSAEVVTLLTQLVTLSRDQNSNLSKILSASTA